MNYNSTSNSIIFYNLSNVYRNASNYLVRLQYTNLNIVPPSSYYLRINNFNTNNNGQLLLSNLQSSTTYNITVTSQINNNIVYNFPRLTASTTASIPSQVVIDVTTLFPTLDSNIIITRTFNTIQYSNIRISSNIRSSTQIFIDLYDTLSYSYYQFYNSNIQFYSRNGLNYMTLLLRNLIPNTQYFPSLTASNAGTIQNLLLDSATTRPFSIRLVTTLFPILASNISYTRSFNTIQYSNIRISSSITPNIINPNKVSFIVSTSGNVYNSYSSNVQFYKSNGLDYMSLSLSNLIQNTPYTTTLIGSNFDTTQFLTLSNVTTEKFMINVRSLFPILDSNIITTSTCNTIQYSNIRISSNIRSSTQIFIDLYDPDKVSYYPFYNSNIQFYSRSGLNYMTLSLRNLIQNTEYFPTLTASNARTIQELLLPIGRTKAFTFRTVTTLFPTLASNVLYTKTFNTIQYSNIRISSNITNSNQISINLLNYYNPYSSNIHLYKTNGLPYMTLLLSNLIENISYTTTLRGLNVDTEQYLTLSNVKTDTFMSNVITLFPVLNLNIKTTTTFNTIQYSNIRISSNITNLNQISINLLSNSNPYSSNIIFYNSNGLSYMNLLLTNLIDKTTYYPRLTASNARTRQVLTLPSRTTNEFIVRTVTTLFPTLASNISYTRTFNTIQYSNIRISSNIRSSTQILFEVYDPGKGSLYTLYNSNIQFYNSNGLSYMTLLLSNLIENTLYETFLLASNIDTVQGLQLSNITTDIFRSNVRTLFPILASNIITTTTFNTIQYSNIRISSNITNLNQISINLLSNSNPYSSNIIFYNSNGLSYMNLLLTNLIDKTTYHPRLTALNARTQQVLPLPSRITNEFIVRTVTTLFPIFNSNISYTTTFNTIQYSNIRISSNITNLNQISINLLNNSSPYNSNIQFYNSNGLSYMTLLLSNLIENTLYTTRLRGSNIDTEQYLTLSNVTTQGLMRDVTTLFPALDSNVSITTTFDTIQYSNIRISSNITNSNQILVSVDTTYSQYIQYYTNNIIFYNSNGLSYMNLLLTNLDASTLYITTLRASNANTQQFLTLSNSITPPFNETISNVTTLFPALGSNVVTTTTFNTIQYSNIRISSNITSSNQILINPFNNRDNSRPYTNDIIFYNSNGLSYMNLLLGNLLDNATYRTILTASNANTQQFLSLSNATTPQFNPTISNVTTLFPLSNSNVVTTSTFNTIQYSNIRISSNITNTNQILVNVYSGQSIISYYTNNIILYNSNGLSYMTLSLRNLIENTSYDTTLRASNANTQQFLTLCNAVTGTFIPTINDVTTLFPSLDSDVLRTTTFNTIQYSNIRISSNITSSDQISIIFIYNNSTDNSIPYTNDITFYNSNGLSYMNLLLSNLIDNTSYDTTIRASNANTEQFLTLIDAVTDPFNPTLSIVTTLFPLSNSNVVTTSTFNTIQYSNIRISSNITNTNQILVNVYTDTDIIYYYSDNIIFYNSNGLSYMTLSLRNLIENTSYFTSLRALHANTIQILTLSNGVTGTYIPTISDDTTLFPTLDSNISITTTFNTIQYNNIRISSNITNSNQISIIFVYNNSTDNSIPYTNNITFYNSNGLFYMNLLLSNLIDNTSYDTTIRASNANTEQFLTLINAITDPFNPTISNVTTLFPLSNSNVSITTTFDTIQYSNIRISSNITNINQILISVYSGRSESDIYYYTDNIIYYYSDNIIFYNSNGLSYMSLSLTYLIENTSYDTILRASNANTQQFLTLCNAITDTFIQIISDDTTLFPTLDSNILTPTTFNTIQYSNIRISSNIRSSNQIFVSVYSIDNQSYISYYTNNMIFYNSNGLSYMTLSLSNLIENTVYSTTLRASNANALQFLRLNDVLTDKLISDITTLFPALDSNVSITKTFNTIQYSNIRISSNITNSNQISIEVYNIGSNYTSYTLYNSNIQFYTSNALNYMSLSLTNLIDNTMYITILNASNANIQQVLTFNIVVTDIFTIKNVTTLFPNLDSNVSIIRTFNTIQYSNIRISSNITSSNQILINLFNPIDNFSPYTNNIRFYNSNGLTYMSLLLSNLIDDTVYSTTLRASNIEEQQDLSLTSVFTLSNLTSLFPNSNLNISIIKTYDTIQYSNIRISSDITSNNQISINLFNNTNNNRPYSSNIQLYTSNGLNYINLFLSNLIDNTVYTTTLRVSNRRRQESLTLSNVITNINPPIIPVQPVLAIYNNYNSITYSNIKPAYFIDNISQYSILVERNYSPFPTVSNIIRYTPNLEGGNSFIDITLLNLDENTLYQMTLLASNISGITSYKFDYIATPLGAPYFPMGLQDIQISCNATSIIYDIITPAYNDYANTYSVIVKDSFNTLLTQPTVDIRRFDNGCNVYYTITINNITPQILYFNSFVATNISGSANLELPYVVPIGEEIYNNFTTTNHNTIIFTKYDISMEDADFLITQPLLIRTQGEFFPYASYTYYKKNSQIITSNATVQVFITNLFPDRIYNIEALNDAAKDVSTLPYNKPYFNEGTAEIPGSPESYDDEIQYYRFKIQAPLNNATENPEYCTIDITPNPRIYYSEFTEQPLPFSGEMISMINIIVGITRSSKYYITLTSTDLDRNTAKFQFPEFIP